MGVRPNLCGLTAFLGVHAKCLRCAPCDLVWLPDYPSSLPQSQCEQATRQLPTLAPVQLIPYMFGLTSCVFWSVIVHKGTEVSCGDYVAYVRSSDGWARMDDDFMTRVSLRQPDWTYVFPFQHCLMIERIFA